MGYNPRFSPFCLERRGFMTITAELEGIINATIERIVAGTVEDIKSDNIHALDPKSIYSKTESLLYNLPQLKKAVQERREQISEIERYGLPKASKSFTVFIPNSGYVDTISEYEKKENKLEQLHGVINELESRIAQIEAAVDTVKDDPYFPIIKMRYYDKKTNAQIAERLKCDEGTVKRHKNKMLESIRFSLFRDVILEDMMNWLI